MATYTSVQSGDWTTPATWGEAVLYPGDGDRAIIADTHVVEIDTDITVGDSPADQSTDVISIQAGGELKWKNVAGDRTLTVKGNIGIARLGRFEIGSSSTPIPATRTATLDFPTDLGPAGGWIIDNQGEFEVCGSRYHMGADDSYQRTKLKSDISSGAGVTFETDDAVDWTVGDVLWFGTGGDPAQAVTGNEKVTITGKTDADTYTATFVNDHHDGDFIIHATRNVILDSDDNTKGVQIKNTFESNDGDYADDLKLHMRWCKLQFFGRQNSVGGAAIHFYPINNVGSDWEKHIPADAVILKNIIIDKGAYTNATFTTFGVYVASDIDFQDTSVFIDEIHMWLQQAQFDLYGWEFHIGHLSFLESYQGVNTTGYGSTQHDGFWFVARGVAGGYAVQGRFRKFENFEIHRYNTGFYFGVSSVQAMLEGKEISNGKIYHAIAGNPAVYFNEQVKSRMYFDNVEFYGSHGAGAVPTYLIWYNYAGPTVFSNCSFDGSRGASYGAIRLGTFYSSDIYCYNCTFGTKEPNQYVNITTNYDSSIGVCRLRFEDCVFKKPPLVDAPEPYFTDVSTWAVSIGSSNPGDTYDDRMNWGASSTIEYVNCQMLDDSDVDQWPNRYPGVTRYAYVNGGGEIRNESTEIIDGSFGAKLLPFSPAGACWVNDMHPIKIPVNSGETITAKLSFKRNANGDHTLPGLKLNGCGIFDEEYLTGSEAFGDWHEIIVSGSAVYDGTAELFISAGTNKRGQTLTKYWQYTFYAPVEPTPPDWDDMFSVVVYADGLDIAVE
jgi:hypothetical protein